ncbi:MAG: hypothetical protein LBJ11_00400 [Oscillospiraceae bacterium]|nr:hypothetical protein [Oscillospiraceae bacterium]
MKKRTRITYSTADFKQNTLSNIYQLIERKAPLLKKALGVNDLPIIVQKQQLIFDWFPPNSSKSDIAAYEDFIDALCQTAWERRWFNGPPRESWPNERGAMADWLYNGLKMQGPEYDLARRLLRQNLPERRRGPKPRA